MNDRRALVLTRVVMAAASFLPALGLPASDWPAFRGPHANGVADAEKPPTSFGAASNLAWKIAVPSGLSSPLVWKDQVLLTGVEGKKLSILAYDAQSGKQRWEWSMTVEKLEPVHKVNSQAASTPVTDGTAVFAYFGSFGLVACDLGGKEHWRKPLPVPKTFMNQGTGTSPILADGKLLVFVQIGGDSHLLAVQPKDGGEIWKAKMPQFNNSYSSPVAWKEKGKGFAGMACARRFTAFDLTDGKEAWWVDGLGYQACGTPASVGDRLVITVAGVQGEPANVTPPPGFDELKQKYDKDGDGLVAFEEIPADALFTDRQTSDGKGNMTLRRAISMMGGLKEGDKLGAKRWEEIREGLTRFRSGPMNQTVVLTVRTGGTNDVTESHVLWKESKGVPEVPSPLVAAGRVYLIRSGGLLVCRELDTGKLVYEERIESPGGYFASPVLADGKIYVASDRGAVTIVKAGDQFEIISRTELGEPILASPALAQNTIFLRTSDHLWAFREKAL